MPSRSSTSNGSNEIDPATTVIHTYEDHPIYSCEKCAVTIVLQDELISKAFSGREGRGFLMNSAVNVRLGKKEDRQLMTGVHTVADVYCMKCDERLGWFYHKAADASQKYKESKFLLEEEKLIKENKWKLDDDDSI